jgi:hypothetical protein
MSDRDRDQPAANRPKPGRAKLPAAISRLFIRPEPKAPLRSEDDETAAKAVKRGGKFGSRGGSV